MADQEPEIIGYFYMHFDRARVKLAAAWGAEWAKPQPLEDVRVYYGEKVGPGPVKEPRQRARVRSKETY